MSSLEHLYYGGLEAGKKNVYQLCKQLSPFLCVGNFGIKLLLVLCAFQ